MDGELGEQSATLRAGVELFNSGRYLAAHELFEELWEGTEGRDSDFYKGLVQAAVALHHFEQGNLAGAAQLHGALRRCLAGYLPVHGGLDLAGFLEARRPASRRSDGPTRGRRSSSTPSTGRASCSGGPIDLAEIARPAAPGLVCRSG